MDRRDVRSRVAEEEDLFAVDEEAAHFSRALFETPLETDTERPRGLPGAEGISHVRLTALGDVPQAKPAVVDRAPAVQLLETHAEPVRGHVAPETRIPHEEEHPGVPRRIAHVEALDVELE